MFSLLWAKELLIVKLENKQNSPIIT